MSYTNVSEQDHSLYNFKVIKALHSRSEFDAEIIVEGKDLKLTDNLIQLITTPASVETFETEYAQTPDGKYIGTVEDAEFLYKRGIVPEVVPGNSVCSIGFCAAEEKWYGWSHRAIYGFGIGDTVKLGDIAYVPSTVNENIAACNSFWDDEYHDATVSEVMFNEDEGKDMIYTSWKYNDKVPNEKIRGSISGVWSEIVLGRGEWTAKTLDDAKQMAIDFAEGVS